MGFSRLSLRTMADWCGHLANSQRAGLSLVKSFELASRQGPARIRQLSATIHRELTNGEDLVTALEATGQTFPPLFMAMAKVSTQTGRLPEVLRELERYYRFQLSLRRKFLGQIFWPMFQLVAAILVIALVIFILGMIGGGKTDLLGLGLTGATGAMIWLAGWMALVALLVGNFWLLRRLLDQAATVDALLLRLPVLGPCLKMLALSRLCFALHMTMETGMSVMKAVTLSLEATSNGAFSVLAPSMRKAIQTGATLEEAFREHALFPDDFLDVLATAEASGTVPESMARLSEQYNERVEHHMALLNTAAGWVVWLIVAAIIIVMIFRIVTVAYLGPLNEAIKGL